MMYKLIIYLKQDDLLLQVHTYYSEEKEDLERRAHYHMSLNESYVSILITYSPVAAEVIKNTEVGVSANDGDNQ